MDNQDGKEGRLARAEQRRKALELRIQERWGKASANLPEIDPSSRLIELYERHKGLCFDDVYDSLKEASIEYAAKYWMLSAVYDRDADIHDVIQERHVFIYPDALYNIRIVESEKGCRNIVNPQSYFGLTKLKKLGTQDFAMNAPQFLEDRYDARERIKSRLMGYKVSDINSNAENLEEWVSNTTRQVLSVFHYDFGDTAKKAGLFHAVKNHAMFAIAHPEKCEELEANIKATTERFLSRVPEILSVQSFIERINAESARTTAAQAKPFAPNVHSLFGKKRPAPEIKEP